MRVLIAFEYGHNRPWEETDRWAVRLAQGLAARGHGVTVACDGWVDPRALDGSAGVTVHMRRPRRRALSVQPGAFARWASARARAEGVDAALSLTRCWAGDVWLPTGRSAADEVRRIVGLRRPATIAMQLADRLWLPALVLAERAAARDARRRGVAALGFAPPWSLGEHDVPMGPGWDAPGDAERAALRARTRALLRLEDGGAERDSAKAAGRVVLAASAAHLHLPGWGAFAAAWASLPPAERPVVLMSGGRPHAATALFERAVAGAGAGGGTARGGTAGVVAIGQTARMDAVLAASDGVVLPAMAAGPGLGPARGPARGPVRGTGRLAAEALSMGVPVWAARGASGWGLIAPRPERPAAGGVVEAASEGGAVGAWAAALRAACDPAARAAAAAAARRRAAEVSAAGVVGAIEARLRVAAERRRTSAE